MFCTLVKFPPPPPFPKWTRPDQLNPEALTGVNAVLSSKCWSLQSSPYCRLSKQPRRWHACGRIQLLIFQRTQIESPLSHHCGLHPPSSRARAPGKAPKAHFFTLLLLFWQVFQCVFLLRISPAHHGALPGRRRLQQ